MKSRTYWVSFLFLCLLLGTQSALAQPGKNKGGGNDGATTDWYIQALLLVEDGGDAFFDKRSGVVGRLTGAENGLDRHDLPVFGSVSSPDAAIVMLPDGGPRQYVSDYRPSGADRQVWTFAVMSGRAGATATLAWDGLYEISPDATGRGFTTALNNGNKLVKTITLIDLETGQQVPLVTKGSANSHTFTMNAGGVRYFRWVQGDVTGDDLTLQQPLALERNASRTVADAPEGVRVRPPLPVMPSESVPSATEPARKAITER